MRDARLSQILEDFRDDDASVHERASTQLEDLARQGLTFDEGCRALRAAAEPWPDEDSRDVSSELVDAALAHPRDGYWALVVDGFPRFSDFARWGVVNCLTELGDEAAARTYLDLVERYGDDGLIPPAPLDEFVESPEAIALLVPALLMRSRADELGYQFQLLAVRAVQADRVPQAALAPFAGFALEMYGLMHERMRGLEEPADDDWIWTDDYLDDRAHATLLLDLMGYLPGEAVLAALDDALTSRDPRIQMFAIQSLLRHGRDVPAEVVERAAASAEVRSWLCEGLESLGRLDLFPPQFATQQAFAEADMVDWLTYPTELGRTPHEIELMATYDDEQEQQRFYLFRFRTHEPHWAADDGWMAGLSGPFDLSSPPQPRGGGSTFSTFTKWDEKTPREHFEAISGLMEKRWNEWHERREAQGEYEP